LILNLLKSSNCLNVLIFRALGFKFNIYVKKRYKP
jgi:hypothetical protein